MAHAQPMAKMESAFPQPLVTAQQQPGFVLVLQIFNVARMDAARAAE